MLLKLFAAAIGCGLSVFDKVSSLFPRVRLYCGWSLVLSNDPWYFGKVASFLPMLSQSESFRINCVDLVDPQSEIFSMESIGLLPVKKVKY